MEGTLPDVRQKRHCVYVWCVWYSSAQTKGSQCGQRKDGLLPEAVKL